MFLYGFGKKMKNMLIIFGRFSSIFDAFDPGILIFIFNRLALGYTAFGVFEKKVEVAVCGSRADLLNFLLGQN